MHDGSPGRDSGGPRLQRVSRRCVVTPSAYNVEHASHRPATPHAPPLFMVRHRVRDRPPPGSSSPVLQTRLSPTCLRAPPRFRTSAHRAAPTGPGGGRFLVGNRLRARRVDRPLRQDPRLAYERQTGRSAARNVLRSACAPDAGQYFTALHPRACRVCTAVSDSNPLRYGISPSNELARLRSLLDDIREKRIPPADALRWIRANSP